MQFSKNARRPSALLLLAVLLNAAPALANPSCTAIFTVHTSAEQNAQAAHDSINADLYTGRVVSIRPFKENDNRNLLFLITLEARDPFTGKLRYRDAFFKPSIFGDGDGYARAGMEYVAYALNRVLLMDYVPPTSYRRRLSIDINGAHYQEGAIIYKVPDFTPMAKLPYEQFNFGDPDYQDAVVSDHRILSVLLQNGDGHYWNLGQGRHWVDGQIRPAFIDWGASLRYGTQASMTHYDVFGNSRPVARVREQTLQALRLLSESQLQVWVDGRFISANEVQFILKIKEGIVQYFDDLIRTVGAEKVLIKR